MKLYPNVTIIFGIWSLATLFIFYTGFSLFPHSGLFPDVFWKNLGNWDGGHYISIAKNGYKDDAQYVFFPLYPILINLVNKITGDFFVAAILISVVCFYLAVNFFYQLISLDFDKKIAQKALIFLLFFPTSFYFLTVYSESLFFLLTVLTFLFLRKNNIFLATITASAASATRISGLAVALALIIYCVVTKKFGKNWFIIFSPLGFILYSFFLWQKFADPFYFTQAETHFWKTGLTIPGAVLIHVFKGILNHNFLTNNFRDVIHFLFAVFGIWGVWQSIKKLSVDYTIYSLFSLTLALSPPTLAALPRYLLMIFPLFIVLSFSKNEYVKIAYQMICLPIFAIFAILFITGFWTS